MGKFVNPPAAFILLPQFSFEKAVPYCCDLTVIDANIFKCKNNDSEILNLIKDL